MRVTLETTDGTNKYQRKTTIEIPEDDLTINDIVEELLKPALLGFGFHQEVLDIYFREDSDIKKNE